jgi:membrane-associated HD superfamily phosphohydrolase
MLNRYFEQGGIITEDGVGGFREYIRNLCAKRPTVCKVAKVAGTVAGAVLLVKGAMNYQKVQTMECYNSKPMFKSKFDAQQERIKQKALVYDKIRKTVEEEKVRLKNERLTEAERKLKLAKLEQDLQKAKVEYDEEKKKIEPIIDAIRDCTKAEKLKAIETQEQLLHEAITEAKESFNSKVNKFCVKHPNLCDLGTITGTLALKAGLIYGAYKGASYYAKKKAEETAKALNDYADGKLSDEDMKAKGIKLPEKGTLELKTQHMMNSLF